LILRKLSILVAVSLAVSLMGRDAGSSVIISELCDPQNNYQTDRFIEIYNSGPDAVDLTNWSLVAVANNAEPVTWPLSGMLNAGQAKVAGYTTPATGFTVHFQSSAWTTNVSDQGSYNWNGKAGDGARLKNASGVLVDQVVATGDLFTDADYVRKPEVTEPTTTYDPSQWTSTPVALATNASPGTHNGSPPPSPGPVISSIVTDPASPAAYTAVDVQASVVDTSGPISSVTLTWGTTSGSLTNSIGMNLLSGSTYRTGTPIPGQNPGITVYYKVQAVGASATSLSSLRSYAIPGNAGAPTILSVGEMSDSTLLVFFSEPVQEASAEVPTNYAVGTSSGVAAVRDPAQPSQVLITIRNLTAGTRTLTVNGVADLEGAVANGITRNFNYVDVTIPAGYYDGLAGLRGSALRVALHNRIKNHTAISYSAVLTAFYTTDVKPNGKVWDVYSDIPGGTPPYEFEFGDYEQGAGEGTFYNREHSWPQSWFDSAAPMQSDLWLLYPTDATVNGYRANYPYGEVTNPTTTSMNGSKLGPNVSPGYSGTVFEPIDPFKGDLARSQFYISTRYFNQDAGWPGSPSTDGADLLPWSANLFLNWSTNDPVSWKERMRNGAIWVIQHNRNPFVDHPEFVAMIYDSNAVLAVNESPVQRLQLRQNLPNPFGTRTTIGFDLAQRERVALRIYDVSGRHVRTLASGDLAPGSHRVEWDGRDDRGALQDAGLYFCRLDAGSSSATRRMVFAR